MWKRLLCSALSLGAWASMGGCSAGRSASQPDVSTLRTLTIVGTSDLHGHLDHLAHFAGILTVLREQRERDHGGLVLLDGGDMFKGLWSRTRLKVRS